MTNQNNQFWLLWCFAIAGIFLSSGKMEAQGQTKPGNVSSTVELWLKANQGVTTDATNNVTVWADQSGNGRNYNGLAPNNFPTLNETTYLMNFHPSIDFRGTANPNNNQKLISASNHFLSASNAYYVFYVSQQAAPATGFATVYAFNAASGGATRNNDYGWLNGKPVFRTASATANSHQGNGKLYGINAVILPNNGTAAQQSYMNGVINSPAFGAATLSVTTPGVSVIGSSNAGTAATDIFKGNVQEIIILSGAVGNYIPEDDLNKINSYLAIKYGITLEAGDYVNSDKVPVWKRTTNGIYDKNIFGIGRDDASGLNQVQSCSANFDLITMFKGMLGETNDNSSEALSDKTYLMLGSNGATGKTLYVYPSGAEFDNKNLSDKINFISKTIYKAQITGDGNPDNSQTVDIQVKDPAARYIFVSGDANFTKENTRIYPVEYQTANDVGIKDGEYLTFAGYESSPGGIGFGYAIDLWVDGNNSTDASWDNLVETNYSLEQFSTNAPVVRNSRFNFNKELFFGNTTSSKLRTSADYNLAAGNTYHIFVVSDAVGAGATDMVLFTFNASATNTNLRWNNSSTTNILSSYWPAAVRSPNFDAATYPRYGIAAMNLSNAATGGLDMYLNGKKATTFPNIGAATTAARLMIGNANADALAGTANAFSGSIQEFILLRNNSSSALMSGLDIAKIQSYLAIKYGITLIDGDYVNSAGTPVWGRTANTGYTKNIFGIGRDDESGLNQVQSCSVENDMLTVYKGSLNELNDHSSTAFSGDKTFLMLGSNGSPGNTKLELPAGALFADGVAIDNKINYISNTRYKAQITGNGGSQTINLKVDYVASRYLLVTPSTNSTFDKDYTRVYPIVENTVTGVVINDGDLIAIAGYEGTPGGIDLTSGYVVDLWVDGNNSTDNSWRNIYGNANYALEKFSTNAPVVRNSRFNFNKELFFGNTTSSKLRTSANYNLAAGNTCHIFVVSDAVGAGATDMVLFTFNASPTNTSLRWNNSSTTNILSSYWTAAVRSPNFDAATYPRYGIAAMNLSNAATGSLDMYLNGKKATTFQNIGAATTAARLMIGNANADAAAGNTNGFNGSIQEIILLRKNSSTALMLDTDVAKIQSYLAIKYGITLTDGDYVGAGGTTVWDRAANDGYTADIFGIGRDDDSGLNQVQSRSANNDMLTVFKGALKELNDQNSGELNDKTYVMFGSNGLVGNVNYAYPADAPFMNGSISNKINYRSNAVYKAQITNGGSSGEPVNIKVNYTFAHYAIVSNTPAFLPENTYIYPIKGGVAAGVVLDDTYKYIATAGYEAKPGGIDLVGNGYTLDLWVDGNNSTNTSWNNLIQANFSLEKYATNAPVVRNSKFNFNKEIYFGNTTSSKLRTSTNYALAQGNAYQAFVVSDARTVTTNSIILTYNAAATTSLLWGASATNTLLAYWNTAVRNTNFSERYGITTLNVVNRTNYPLELDLNRKKSTFTLATTGNSTTRLMIGNANADTGTGSANPFNGSIQEIILIKKSSPSTELMPDDMIAKIHSYLAVKYGITLPAFDYVNSGGNIVWSKEDNSGYGSNIFGLGRDDDSGLYQKQSQSVNDSTLTVFLGDLVAALNSDNTGTLDDKQFMMIGRNINEKSPAMTLANANIINNGLDFANGPLNTNLSNVQSPRYKVQFTGEIPEVVKLMSSLNYFTHLIVSKNEAFNNKSEMKVYELKDGVAEVEFDNEYRFFKFIGSMEGPGGVSVGLLLWLQADNPASLSIVDYPLTDPSLNGYLFAKDPAAIPTVNSWRDLKREHTWNYANGGTSVNRRRPVFENAVRKMNYHPAVRFWGNGTTTSAYLANKTGIIAKHPTTHTAFFMMNSALNDNSSRIYEMMFTPNLTAPGVNGPAYGIEKRGIKGMGRYRGIANSDGNKDLFTVGTTTIASYYVQDAAGTGVKFRFNGIENTGNTFTASNACRLSQGSVLGMGYDNSRTVQGFISEAIIYNGLIDSGSFGIENRDKVESYLALKYGVTLYPFPEKGTENRFDYKFSSGEYIWQGQTGDSRFAAFYKRVAALVRDDIASLNNKQTISTDIGSMLHLGVAGAVLDIDGKGELGELNNMEAVAFGDNNAFGFTDIEDNACGDFDSRFNRIWLIHKKTEDDRPVKIIVGIQDNSSEFVIDASDTENKANDDYYAKLNGTYDVALVVADSPEDIQNGNYKRVIPMTYINKVWQCIYEFSDEDTYITFGTKPNMSGCVLDEEAAFVGTKTFNWTQWTTRTNLNSSTASGLTLPATPFPPLDLGDNIQVLQTQVSYPPDVRTYMHYPRSIGIPVRGSLELMRRQGAVDQDVVVTVTFNHPVIPQFSISGLDCYGSYAFEEVEITGGCSAGDESFMPALSYAAPRSSRTSYLINGNKATVIKRGYMSGTDKNAMVNVKFFGSVSTITIKYRIKGRVPTAALQRIYISPITFKTAPPPPPVNEDGLSFVKDVKEYNITTCEPAEYSFYIQNTNCDVKTVSFSDVLPEKMKWDTSSFVLDTLSSNMNQEIEYEVIPASAGDTLKIDGLQLPGSATLVLKASAVLDADAQGGVYDNQATVIYDLIRNNELETLNLSSMDRYTHDPKTSFTATWQQRMQKVEIEENYSLSKYKENNEIVVTYKINNPNPFPVTDMFLDIDFNEEFTYIEESFSGGTGSFAPILTLDPENPSTLTITGSLDGAEGFTLPAGETVITFKLKAPDADHLRYELDDAGQPTEKKADLDIIYNFSSTMDDPCVIEAVKELSGDKAIPYSTGLNYIISNRNVTSKIE